jgi:hypothetical protein
MQTDFEKVEEFNLMFTTTVAQEQTALQSIFEARDCSNDFRRFQLVAENARLNFHLELPSWKIIQE